MRPAGARSSRIDVGEAETEAFWTDFLRGLVKRGLVGVQLAISDAHAGLKAAIAKVLGCAWQRCTVHFLSDCLGHARKDQHGLLGGADPADLQRRLARAGARSALRGRRASRRADAARSRRCSRTPRPTSSPSTRSRPRTGASCAPPTRSSASTRRSAAAPTSSASSPTTPRLIRLAGMLCIEQNDCHEGRQRRRGGLSSPRRTLGAVQGNRFDARRQTCSISGSTGAPAARHGAPSREQASCRRG